MLNSVRQKPIVQRLSYALKGYVDMDKDFFPLYEVCRPYTMTSIERMYALYQAVKHVVQNNIEGDFVECGVWKGGSAMLIAATLDQLRCYDKKVYLYDTFEGMSEPSEKDKNYAGVDAKKQLTNQKNNKENSLIWAYCSIGHVKQNFSKINYPIENVFFVKGKVEDTIHVDSHKKVSLLRLDTDWYESTYHEMKYLYPVLEKGGVIIIDDYGHWQGAREAIDQYMQENNVSLLLNRIDYTGRIAIKS
ncbi:MAG: TylF/MycF family methyltransferase [Bacteroidales bacterium]|nr:TylF/MycF family methyltransferase [Bacteroidales bacterium]